jgi:ComF family protein
MGSAARLDVWRRMARQPAWRSLAPPVARGAAALVDLVFPPSCLACRKAIDTTGALCPPCWSAIRFIERPFCERLGTPFATDLGAEGLLSPDAIANPPVYARARAVAHFDDGPARSLVHRLKYGDRLELARTMGAWMARAGDELLTEADVLVPVPLHRGRLARRRFNQAALLAAHVSRRTGVPVDAFALSRVKPTPPQVGLTRTQRAANVQGAFRVDAEMRGQIAGKAVVLVDDVLTSGATINAASRAVLRGGAKRVDVLVFARVVVG